MKRLAISTAAFTAIAAALMAARPVSELQLLTQLNGQPTRWVLPDGGRSGLYASSGRACATLSGTDQRGATFTPNVLLFVPETPTNVCIRPLIGTNGVTQPWDGGCNTIEGDQNFGTPLQPFVPFYFVPTAAATTVCGASDAGTVQGALFQMQ